MVREAVTMLAKQCMEIHGQGVHSRWERSHTHSLSLRGGMSVALIAHQRLVGHFPPDTTRPFARFVGSSSHYTPMHVLPNHPSGGRRCQRVTRWPLDALLCHGKAGPWSSSNYSECNMHGCMTVSHCMPTMVWGMPMAFKVGQNKPTVHMVAVGSPAMPRCDYAKKISAMCSLMHVDMQ